MEQELTTQQAAARALLTRRSMRRSLLEWCRFLEAKKGQQPAAHHRLIIAVLQAIEDRSWAEFREHYPQIPVTDGLFNVMLLMPPGAAKSTYTSIDFVPHYLCKHPLHLVLACSYSYSLIEGFGRQARDIIDLYSNELGYKLSTTAAASGDWRIETTVDGKPAMGGGYFCAGVGSGIAGHRADVAFIDDYLGSQQDADSEVIREKQWAWYWNDFWPRLKPTSAQIIIANRRHEEDLVGKLLKTEPQKWVVISLPYFAEANDPLGRPCGVEWNEKTERMEYKLESRLWPEWFGVEHAKDVMKLEARVLAGLYQQRPTAAEGSYFKRHMLVGYSLEDLAAAERAGMRYYVGSDYAVRKGQLRDKFCYLPAGVDTNDRLWILPDWYWAQADTLEAAQAMFGLAARRKPITWWAGRENIVGSIEPFLLKMMQETGVYIPIDQLSEARDKEAKAQPIKARMSQKMVMFPKFLPQWNEAEAELLAFPGGANDDFVDALSKLGQGLSGMIAACAKSVEVEPNLNGYSWKPTATWLRRSSARVEHSKPWLRQLIHQERN